MKKVFHITLSILLLAATTGVSVSKHFCGQEIYDVALYAEAQPCHDHHEGDMNGCCDDEVERHQLKDDFQTGKTLKSVDFQPLLLYVLPEFIFSGIPNIINADFSLNPDISPPRLSGKLILVKAQQFLL